MVKPLTADQLRTLLEMVDARLDAKVEEEMRAIRATLAEQLRITQQKEKRKI